MNLKGTHLGKVRLKLTSANLSALLLKLNQQEITLYSVRQSDELTASFGVSPRQYQMVVRTVEDSGGKITNRIPATGSLLLQSLIRRPVLIFGVLLMLFLTFYLPSKILFIKVSGNDTVTEKEIVEAAADCGIYFGASRHETRSEKVKNRLLSKIPELKWVGVNTRGCVAEISVRERVAEVTPSEEPIISSVVASRDGVIRQITVTAGNPISKVGQAVRKGQLLVSGYSDCGRCIYGTRAEAEVYAQTRRNLTVFTPAEKRNRGQSERIQRKIGFVIGKKRINLYKGSGISDTSCVRMYVEYPLTLPGGFQLPVALAVQEQIAYVITSETTEPEDAEPVLHQYANTYLVSQMIAGKIEQGSYQSLEMNGAHCLIGEYICDEMIGQTRSEEIVKPYE